MLGDSTKKRFNSCPQFCVGSCFALLLAIVLMLSSALLLPRKVYAAEAAVFTATTAVSYANPDTGVIEDSGGEANAALGQSMVQGIVSSQAFVEKDIDGRCFVTLRMGQGDSISQVIAASDHTHSGSFNQAVYALNMANDSAANTSDWLFEVPSEASTFRISMFVAPMGRDVIYFVQLGNYQEGNFAGFVQSVDTSPAPQQIEPAPEQGEQTHIVEPSQPVVVSSAADPASEQDPQSTPGSEQVVSAEPTADAELSETEKSSSASASDKGDVQTDESSAAELGAQTTTSGIHEYDADGHELSTDHSEDVLEPAVVVGLVAALVCVAGIVAAIVVHSKRAAQDAAAKAAAPRSESKCDESDAS